MVDGMNLREKLLRVTDLPFIEPEIEVNTQLLFLNAALRERSEYRDHFTAIAIGVACYNLDQICESSTVITVDYRENVWVIYVRVHRIELPNSAMNLVADRLYVGSGRSPSNHSSSCAVFTSQ